MAFYLICYAVSWILARQHVYMLSGLVLIPAAFWLYWKDYRESGNLINLKGLFCLSFAGGQGISCLKLSRLQTDWSYLTWLCFLLAVVVFRLAGRWKGPDRLAGRMARWRVLSREKLSREMLPGQRGLASGQEESPEKVCRRVKGRILWAMGGITLISLAAFLLEAAVLGFIPMFSYGVPHAYSYFHISGVHYFTVSCVLVPSLLVVWLEEDGKGAGRLWQRLKTVQGAAALGFTAVSLAIPLLCVSRFQLILAVGMAVFTFISISRRFRLKYVLILLCCMVPAYLGLTVLRSHSVEYLNGIFEMKNGGTPIWITQPYMYIANNYDNFNCLVEQLPSFAMGLRMLFPLWAFTGLKFLAPGLVNFPLYVTKEELTTVTILYDSYYDFGVFGVILFALLLGLFCRLLSGLRERLGNPVVHVIYAQIAMYMALAFFTTWFSNPSTWFYLGATVIAAVFVGWKRK